MRKLVGIYPSVCLYYHGYLDGVGSSHFSVYSCRHIGVVHGRHAVWGVVGRLSNCVCVCVREGGGREGERIKISHCVLHNKLDLLQIKLASFLLSSCRLLTSYDMKELDGTRPGNTARQNLHYINTSSHKAKSNATT